MTSSILSIHYVLEVKKMTIALELSISFPNLCILEDFCLLICRYHSNFVNCIRYSPDGIRFISVSSDKKGLIYDGKTGEKIGELSSEDGHKGSIYAVSWSPDSKQVSPEHVLSSKSIGNFWKTLLVKLLFFPFLQQNGLFFKQENLVQIRFLFNI